MLKDGIVIDDIMARLRGVVRIRVAACPASACGGLKDKGEEKAKEEPGDD